MLQPPFSGTARQVQGAERAAQKAADGRLHISRDSGELRRETKRRGREHKCCFVTHDSKTGWTILGSRALPAFRWKRKRTKTARIMCAYCSGYFLLWFAACYCTAAARI